MLSASLCASALSGCGMEFNHPAQPRWEDPARARRGTEIYRVGDEWSRPLVNESVVSALPLAEQTWLRRIVKVPGGTGFLLGIQGEYGWVFTNRHVTPTDEKCNGTQVLSFPVGGQKALCVQRLRAWPQHDLALLKLTFDANGPGDLATLPFLQVENGLRNLRGDWLATAGFGVAGQTSGPPLTLSRDSDCRGFTSATQELSNPLVMSFAMGCDVSPGDSGSPIWERETGRWVGVTWGGFAPKIEIVQRSLDLARWLTGPQDEPDVWTTLNFSVSLLAARTTWETELEDPETPEELAVILRLLVDQTE